MKVLRCETGVIATTVLVGLHCISHAQTPLADREPEWWSNPATAIWSASRVNVENAAVVNIGQLKHVASRAKIYLDNILAPWGGAGPEITALVAGFQGGPGSPAAERAENDDPALVGQLKMVGDLFYKRLAELGIDAATDVAARFNATSSVRPGATYKVPWSAGAPASENGAPATIGQLKIVFGINMDQDNDALLDAYEWNIINNSGGTLSTLAQVTPTTHPLPNSSSDSDGDGLTNAEEFDLKTNPFSIVITGSPSALAVQYDSLDRLSGITGSGPNASFSLDNAGNILSAQHSTSP